MIGKNDRPLPIERDVCRRIIGEDRVLIVVQPRCLGSISIENRNPRVERSSKRDIQFARSTEGNPIWRFAVVLVEYLKVRGAWMRHQRQRIDFSPEKIPKLAYRIRGDGEIDHGSVGTQSQSVSSEGHVEPAILEPNLRRPPACRNSPDRSLKGIGFVKITVLIKSDIVPQRRRVKKSRRARCAWRD